MQEGSAHPVESMAQRVPCSLNASQVSVAPGVSGSTPRAASAFATVSHTQYCSSCITSTALAVSTGDLASF